MKTIFVALSIICTPLVLLSATDIHVHVDAKNTFGDPPEAIFKSMSESGLDQSFVISSAYLVGSYDKLEGSTVAAENNYVAELGAKYPDKLIPVCSVPFYDINSFKEIERCSRTLKIRVLKLHTLDYWMLINGKDAPDFTKVRDFRILTAFLKKASEEKMVVFLHSSFISGEEFFSVMLDAVKRNYAEGLQIVLLHGLGASYFQDLHMIVEFREWAHKSQKPFPDIYIDLSDAWTSFPEGSPRREEWFAQVEYFGVEHVLFGSDGDVKGGLAIYEEIFGTKGLSQILNKNPTRLKIK